MNQCPATKVVSALTFSSLLDYFSYFSRKKSFDIKCVLSPKEIICMEGQKLFSGKIKKNVLKCRLLIFYTEC